MEKYTLIVTEKPDAAKRIAQALDTQGNPQKLQENGVPYFVAQRDRKLVVVPAIGHLHYRSGKRKTQLLPCLRLQVDTATSGRAECKSYSQLGWRLL